MRRTHTIALVTFLAVCAAVAVLGSAPTATAVKTWYPTLVKPQWTPPSWLFAPVWTALYIAMAVSGWLVWRARTPGRTWALGVFAFQLAANGLWSWLFFGWHRLGLALADIVVLWLAILATILLFRKASTAAAWLLVPYLAWVSFALLLNAAILKSNS